RGRWQRWGLLLGLLVTAQFFVGVELLTITAMMLGFALLIVLVLAMRQRGLLAARWPYAWHGLAVAARVSVLLLGSPLWYALKGPEHIKGVDWQALKDNGFKEMLLPLKQANLLVTGYLGAGGARGAYLGLAALAVVVIAVLVVRKPLVYACA